MFATRSRAKVEYMTVRGGRWTFGMTRAVVAALVAVALCPSLPAPAVAATHITADIAAGRALGTTVSASGSIYSIDGGTLVGPNLFHSFSDFSLAAGDTAAWVHTGGNAGSITRVINRVTGGSPSTIFGTLDSSALPNADFYFINPAGVVFGAGAVVNVPGAAYFSTASALKFADGSRFSAATPSGSVLTMAAPAAFGFLGGEGNIAVDGVDSTFFPGAGKLSLTAANIQITGSVFTAGALDLFAAGSKAIDLGLTGAAPAVGTLSGAVSITAVSVLTVQPTALENAAARLGGGSVLIDGSSILSETVSANADPISIAANSVTLQNGGFVFSETSGGGAGSDINFSTGALEMVDASVSAQAGQGSTGNGGSINILAGTVGILQTGFGAPGAGINAYGLGLGRIGNITIYANELAINDAGIGSQTLGPGAGGNVELHLGTLSVDSGLISSSTSSAGASGSITISANTIDVLNGGQISTSSRGAGPGGPLAINTGTLTVQSGGSITADAAAAGRAGGIAISADNLLVNGGTIAASADPFSTGAAGTLDIKATNLGIVNGGMVDTGTSGSGLGGAVTIEATNLLIVGGQLSANTYGVGHAGSVSVAAGSIAIDSGYLQSTAYPGSTGDAGSVTVNAGTVNILSGGHIGSDTFGPGDAGSVTLDADVLNIVGNGFTDIRGSGIESVSVFSGASGNAGQIDVVANTIHVSNAGYIAASTLGPGRAGDVSVTANSLVLDGGLVGSRAEVGSTGNAGQTTVNAGAITIDNGGFISTDTFGPGNAGSVSVTAGSIDLSGGGAIRSDANAGSTGQSGSVLVNAQTLDLHDGGLIETNSANANAAGDITVNAPSVVVDGTGSQISSANSFAGGGSAGNISIFTDPITLSNGGLINTNSVNGPAGDITLVFQNGGLLVLEGTSAQGQITTTSGTQSGGLISILGPTSILMNGGLIQALGPGNAALVTIQAGSIIESTDRPNDIAVAGVLALDSQIVDVGKSVTTSQADFVDASAVLRGQCADRRAHGQTNQLGTRSVGPYGAADATIAGAGSKLFACGRSGAAQ
jgi:filamentous hemagglutinin family protein